MFVIQVQFSGNTYLGFAIRIHGNVAGESADFWLGVGPGAQKKHQFEVGHVASGGAHPVADKRREPAEFYRVSGVKIEGRSSSSKTPPPWHGVAPPIEVYRDRGHRRLSVRAYAGDACCIWGARMPVEIIVDHWNPVQKRYRSETFCYGPKSCRLYRPGPTRKVPGRRGITYEEGDWVDAESTANRSPDE